MNSVQFENNQNLRRTGKLNAFAKSIILHLLRGMTEGKLIIRDGADYFEYGNSAWNVKENAVAEIVVRNPDFWQRCLLYGDLGLAESYLDELIDMNVREVISFFLLNSNDAKVLNENKTAKEFLFNALGALNATAHRVRHNSVENSRRNISAHYDLGNEFFSSFLDDSMAYSSALFEDAAASLSDAQKRKFERIAESLCITRDDHVLDLGCGWGGLTLYIAKRFQCRVTAVTISKNQSAYVRELTARERLQHLVDVIESDYRHLQGKFTKIASIEMIEAIGDEYMENYIGAISRLLHPSGLALLQMITCADVRYESIKRNADFIQKHIFPGSLLPSYDRVQRALRRVGSLQLNDFFDMTSSYVRTLECWQENFRANAHAVESLGFDQYFMRKWNYYFEYCQAAFDMRQINVVQATFTHPNNLTLRRQARR